METVPNWLNYGAFGLLAMVLVIIGIFVNARWKENTERSSKETEFSQRLAEKAVESLQQVVKENTEAQVVTRETLQALIAEFKSCDARAHQERQEIKQAIERNA